MSNLSQFRKKLDALIDAAYDEGYQGHCCLTQQDSAQKIALHKQAMGQRAMCEKDVVEMYKEAIQKEEVE